MLSALASPSPGRRDRPSHMANPVRVRLALNPGRGATTKGTPSCRPILAFTATDA